MKNPKVKISTRQSLGWSAYVEYGAVALMSAHHFPTRKAAREWAEDWCRMVGAALLVKAGTRPEVVRLSYPGVERDK